MKLSIVMMAAAAVYAAPADDQQAALAPSADRDMQQLLSMDSFNITSADSEQNRMHAVCDMEYRLSKMTGSGVVTNALMAASTTTTTSSTAVNLFNPFTMPLMAVKQHISLLQQQEKFLQAQSDAFSGSSSSTATTTAPSTVSVPSCSWIANDATSPTDAAKLRSAAGAKTNADSIVIGLTTAAAAQAGQVLQITIDLGEVTAGAAQTLAIPTINTAGTDALGSGKRPCFITAGADRVCKKPDGQAMAGTGIARVAGSKNPEGTASTVTDKFENSVSGADVAAGKAGIIVGYTLTDGVEKLEAGSYWFIGALSALAPGTTAKATVTAEFLAGTATANTLLGKGKCTMTV